MATLVYSYKNEMEFNSLELVQGTPLYFAHVSSAKRALKQGKYLKAVSSAKEALANAVSKTDLAHAQSVLAHAKSKRNALLW